MVLRWVVAEVSEHEKAAVTRWCPRPLEPPRLKAPVGRRSRAVRALAPVPPGRAASASSCVGRWIGDPW